MIETTNNEFTYCVLSPERMDGEDFVEANAFGVGPDNDPTRIYDKVFNLSAKAYQVLTFCIYEVNPNFTQFNNSVILALRLQQNLSPTCIERTRIHASLFLQLRQLQCWKELLWVPRQLEGCLIYIPMFLFKHTFNFRPNPSFCPKKASHIFYLYPLTVRANRL
jgi:hypothetical protein